MTYIYIVVQIFNVMSKKVDLKSDNCRLLNILKYDTHLSNIEHNSFDPTKKAFNAILRRKKTLFPLYFTYFLNG